MNFVDSLSDEEKAAIAQAGDAELRDMLWAESRIIASKICKRFAVRYVDVDVQDLVQDVLVYFPAILANYRPATKTRWTTYLSCVFWRRAQDALRKHDPLGIKWPQKRTDYPEYGYLGGVQCEQVVAHAEDLSEMPSLRNGLAVEMAGVVALVESAQIGQEVADDLVTRYLDQRLSPKQVQKEIEYARQRQRANNQAWPARRKVGTRSQNAIAGRDSRSASKAGRSRRRRVGSNRSSAGNG